MSLFKKKTNNQEEVSDMEQDAYEGYNDEDTQEVKEKRHHKAKKELGFQKPPTNMLIVFAVSLVLCLLVGGAAIYALAKKPISGSKNNDAQNIDVEEKARAQIQQITGDAHQLDSLCDRMFADTSAALYEFTDEFNDMSEDWEVVYNNGSSFARTAQYDPFGTQYYITAKKDSTGEARSTYSFYVVSAGANRLFDVNTFTTDSDDIFACILQGNMSTQGNGSQEISMNDPDFGLSDILSNHENDPQYTPDYTQDTPEQNGELPIKVMLIFDPADGTGGTESIRVKNGLPMNKYSVDTPIRINYKFNGYYTGKNGSGEMVFNASGIGQGEASFAEDTTLYAYWVGEEVSVSLDKGDGSGATTITARYDEYLPSVSAPQRAGYYFIGYYSQKNGGGTRYYDSNGHAVMKCDSTSALILYAFWSSESYTVQHFVMQPDGRYPATPDKTDKMATSPNKTVNLADLVDTSILVKDGIAFSKGTVNGAEVDTIPASDQKIVVALYYQRETYEVSVETGEGISKVTGANKYYYGQNVTLNAVMEEGYSWDSWVNSKTKETVTTKAQYQFTMPAEPVKLTAKAKLNTYTIKLDANGGELKTEKITVSYGEAYYAKLPTTATRKGYGFAGWSDKKTDTTATITADTKFTQKSGITLYAIWTSNSYTITLDLAGGTGGVKTVAVKTGENMPAITSVPTRTGYEFKGYYSGKNGEGTQYYDANGSSKKTADFTANTTLYAAWEAKTVPINYYDYEGNAFSGTHAFGAPTTAKYGEKTTLKTAKRAGYTFGGWFTTPECDGKAVTEITPESFKDGVVNLFADWLINTVRITYKVDPLSAPPTIFVNQAELPPMDLAPNEKMPTIKSSQFPGDEEYFFLGFFTERGGAGTQIYNEYGEPIVKYNPFTDDTILYAKMGKRTLTTTVTLNANGGTGGTASVKVNKGDVFPDINVPTKDGFEFLGYFITINETEAKIYDGAGRGLIANPFKNEEITLVAEWKDVSCTITFDVQGGTGGQRSLVATKGLRIPGITNVPTKANCYFGGYFTAANGAGTKVYDELGNSLIDCPNQSTLTLYAKWDKVPYPIAYRDSGDTAFSGNMPSAYATVGYVGDTITLPVPTKDGKTFGGWFLTSDCSGSAVTTISVNQSQYETMIDPSSQTVNPVILYALWN